MFRSILAVARRNAVASLALALAVLALAGGAYAALRLPANSVSTKQLVNHRINPPKLEFGLRSFGGYVAHWATVNSNGTIAGGSQGAVEVGSGESGYAVQWGNGGATQRIARCAPEVTVQGAPPPGVPLQSPPATPGYATAIVANGDYVIVRTYDSAGLLAPEPFYITVTC